MRKTHWKAYTRRQGDIQHMYRHSMLSDLKVGNIGTNITSIVYLKALTPSGIDTQMIYKCDDLLSP